MYAQVRLGHWHAPRYKQPQSNAICTTSRRNNKQLNRALFIATNNSIKSYIIAKYRSLNLAFRSIRKGLKKEKESEKKKERIQIEKR